MNDRERLEMISNLSSAGVPGDRHAPAPSRAWAAAGLLVLLVVAAATVGAAVAATRAATAATEAARAAQPMAIRNGVSFSVTCDTTAAGIPVVDSSPVGSAWNSLYCENNSTTTVSYGWPAGGTLDTTIAPCVSTTAANCLRSSFSLDVLRSSGLACKTGAGSQMIKCIAGGG